MHKKPYLLGALKEQNLTDNIMANLEAGQSGTVDLDTMNFAGDDAVVPFQIDGLDVRGRSVQLGAALDGILSRHNYPEPVARLLAEIVVLTVLLGTSLKFQGKFILQTQSDGPVDMLVADFTTPDSVRAYARYDLDRVNEAVEKGETAPEQLIGKGTLGLTVDQGSHMQRYQGIVPLDGSTLEDIARTYFRQSEQIPTEIRLAVAKLVTRGEDGKAIEQWRAGGLMVQFLPHSVIKDKELERDLSAKGDESEALSSSDMDQNKWDEARSLVGTIEDAELTDPQVPAERLLYRLFHEQGARIYEPVKVTDTCTCSRDKIVGVLSGFSAEEIKDSVEDGEISVTCEFCSTRYVFDPEEFSSK